jgi:predicted ester cyclase
MLTEENKAIENKAIVRRYLEEVWTKRTPEALEEFYPSYDLVQQEGPAEQGLPSLDDAIEYVRQVQAAFPDLSVTIEDIIAEEDRVAVRTTWRGTYEGEPIGGIDPTNETVTLSGNVIWRIVKGKVVHMWGTQDEEVYELGVMPYLEKPGAVFFKFPIWRC